MIDDYGKLVVEIIKEMEKHGIKDNISKIKISAGIISTELVLLKKSGKIKDESIGVILSIISTDILDTYMKVLNLVEEREKKEKKDKKKKEVKVMNTGNEDSENEKDNDMDLNSISEDILTAFINNGVLDIETQIEILALEIAKRLVYMHMEVLEGSEDKKEGVIKKLIKKINEAITEYYNVLLEEKRRENL